MPSYIRRPLILWALSVGLLWATVQGLALFWWLLDPDDVPWFVRVPVSVVVLLFAWWYVGSASEWAVTRIVQRRDQRRKTMQLGSEE